MPRTAVTMLGSWQVLVAGRTVELPAGQLRLVLASLALAADQLVPLETLAGQLWPERPPSRAAGALHTYVSRLRGLLGTELIETVPGGYRLRVDEDAVDVLRFRALCREAARASSAPAELRLLREALALWRGRPFGGMASTWLDREVVPKLTEEWFAATERRFGLELAAGPAAARIAELTDLANRFRTRESLWLLLIRALDQAGRRAEALDRYHVLRATLRDELGTRPGPELSALHGEILRDDGRTPTRARQLPHDIRSFVGRDAELAALDGLLDGRPLGHVPALVCIDGAPGTGKTTLAVHWAHQVASSYADAQLYVNLRGYGPGEPVPAADAAATLLRTLGIAADRVPPGLDERSALLRSTLSGHKALLVLDNARSADQIRPLLPGSHSLVLVTSRNQLRGLSVRDGAHRVTLRPLEPGKAVELLATAIDPGRIAAEPEAANRLAELCDRLPLALAIVAERAQHADSLAEFAAALDSGAVDEIGNALSWSYEALEPGAAALFRRLGLYPGDDIGAGAAAALAGVPDVRSALDQLVAAHLLEQRRPGRYQMHDLIRMYAGSLAAAEAEPARACAVQRLLDWYLDTALAADRRVNPLRRQDYVEPFPRRSALTEFGTAQQAMEWFTDELDRLRTVSRWAAGAGHPAHGWRIVLATWSFLRGSLPIAEGVELVEQAVAAAAAADEPHGRGYTLNLLGAMHLIGRAPDRAESRLAEALGCFEQIGHERGQAMVLGNLGMLAIESGRPSDATGYLARTIELSERSGDRGGLANNLTYLGAALSATGRYDEAVGCHLRAEAINGESGDPADAANQYELARAYVALGRTRAAVRAFRRSIAVFREIGDHRAEADSRVELARLLLGIGHDGLARGLLRSAHTTWTGLGDHARAAEIEPLLS